VRWNIFKGTRRELDRPRAVDEPMVRSAFHAVDIVSPSGLCDAARRLEGQRFLSSDGPPTLPLTGCDRSTTCLCRYRHHDDRRSGARRQEEQVWASQQSWPDERERRQSRGRRSTDP
jgi:hypothetical protein